MDLDNVEELENLANGGNVTAMYELGKKYFLGNGVDQNLGKAKYYLENASERGNRKADYYLGKMYYNGTGVATDYGKAKYYFEKSSEANNVFSTYYLGKLYFWGDGVEKDYEKANDCKNTILNKPLYVNQDTELENFYSIQDFEQSTINFVNDIQVKVIKEYKSLYGEE